MWYIWHTMSKHYTVGQVAAELGYTRETVRKWLQAGALRGHRFGKRSHWRVTEENLTEFKRRYRDDDSTAQAL